MATRLCALALAVTRAAAAGTCDKNCVCDGLDLSGLGAQSFEAVGLNRTHNHTTLDPYKFRISVCEALTQDELAGSSCSAAKKPRVVRFLPGKNNTDADPKDCYDVGQEIVSAVTSFGKNSNKQGVRLVFSSTAGGQQYTVIANVHCSPAGGAEDPQGVSEKQNDDGSMEYEFDWPTQYACKRPAPVCDDSCRCAGLDLSRLKTFVGTAYGETPLKGWKYLIDVCDPIASNDMPDVCPSAPANILQYPPTADKEQSWPNRTGCSAVGNRVTGATLKVAKGEVGVDIVFEGRGPALEASASNEVWLSDGSGDGPVDDSVATSVTGHLTCAHGQSGDEGMGQVFYINQDIDPATNKTVDRYEFSWATEAACSEARPLPSATTAGRCDASCSCAGQDLGGLKDKQYTVKGTGKEKDWTYVFSICGPITNIPEKDKICRQIPATATAMRYKKDSEHGQEEFSCELLGADSRVVATKSGVELFYASSVNSSDCIEGSSFQLSVVCDATATASAVPESVADISSTIYGNGNAPANEASCVFATRLLAPCAAATEAEKKKDNNNLLIILGCVGGGVVLLGVIVGVVVSRKKGRSVEDYQDSLLENEHDFSAQ